MQRKDKSLFVYFTKKKIHSYVQKKVTLWIDNFMKNVVNPVSCGDWGE